VYITSREGDIITVNPALVEMLGYDSAQELKQAGRTTMLYVNPTRVPGEAALLVARLQSVHDAPRALPRPGPGRRVQRHLCRVSP
jgi:PAS domain-containing protein